MNIEVSIDKFIELVKDKKIHCGDSVSIYANELLELLKEKLENQDALEKFKSTNENLVKRIQKLETENYILETDLSKQRSLNTSLQKKVLNAMEHEKIQRNRATRLENANKYTVRTVDYFA